MILPFATALNKNSLEVFCQNNNDMIENAAKATDTVEQGKPESNKMK